MDKTILTIGDYRVVLFGDILSNVLYFPSISISYSKNTKSLSFALAILWFTGSIDIENRYAYEDHMDDVFDKISVGLAKQIHEYYERNYLNKK